MEIDVVSLLVVLQCMFGLKTSQNQLFLPPESRLKTKPNLLI
jgi:hypothetical protein